MLLVEFYDEVSLLNSLLSIKSLLPEKVLFLVDDEDYKEELLNDLVFSVRNISFKIKVEFLKIQSNELYQTKDAILKKINIKNDEKVYIGISKGNQVSSICGYMVSEEDEDVTLIYNRLHEDQIVNLKDSSFICELKHLNFTDFLMSVGASTSFSSSHSLPLDEEKEMVCNMGMYIFEHIITWSSLNYLFIDCLKDRNTPFKVPCKDTMQQEMMDQFVYYGFLTYENEYYSLVKEKYFEYLRTFGIWLEMYTYFKIKEIYPETYLGVIIDWNRKDGMDTVDNEIDVVTLHKSTLYFISCKMRQPKSLDVYEVGYLAKKLGGYEARALLCTTDNVARHHRFGKRLKTMNVGLLRPTCMDEDIKEDILKMNP